MTARELADLARRWRDLLSASTPGADLDAAFAEVAAAYAGPGRHYHDLAHVRAVLDVLDQLLPQAPLAARLAAWLHDVVYDPYAADNEARSAAYARALAQRLALPEAVGEEAARLIGLTRRHHTDADDAIGQALLDADLAVLAADAAAYDAYAAAIRREYARVPPDDYRAGRRRVLEQFLARPHLYHTPAMRSAEPRARQNLARELRRLADPA